MKKKKENFGILINGKIPKNNKEKNRFCSDIRLKFKGRAFIVKDDLSIKKELKNDEIIKTDGQYLIMFINENDRTFYINVEVRKIFLLIMLISIIILLSCLYCFKFNNYLIENQLIEDSIKYEYNLKGDKFVFNIGYGDTEYKEVELFDKMSNSSKIYPGSSGYFYIYMNTSGGNKEIVYRMEIEQEKNKPEFLKYELNGKTYNSMQELSQDVNGIIKEDKDKVIKISWSWDYESDNDEVDTDDGSNIKDYSFLMRIIGSENI